MNPSVQILTKKKEKEKERLLARTFDPGKIVPSKRYILRFDLWSSRQ